MRRVALAVLLAVLAALVAVRLRTERPAAEAAAVMAMRWDSEAYNALPLEAPRPAGTAGSSLVDGLTGYFFSRTPTAKTDYTGLLAGRDLILLLAEDWAPGQPDRQTAPTLWQLWQTGVRFENVYAPAWYQGTDGREFALLAGMIPTTVEQSTALAWTGRQGIYLPFSLGSCLTAAGYSCRACPAAPGRADAYRALGFASEERSGTEADRLCQAAEELSRQTPYALYCVLTGTDGEQTLARLWQTLEQAGRLEDTVICLWAQGGADRRGSLFLWADGLAQTAVSAPCSELDVTPTLLDLLGADYDGRFLWGRDVLADGPDTDQPVCLSGSAYADWVSPAGAYDAAREQFCPVDGRFSGEQETARYVQQTRQAVYERYVFARQVMECDYFRQAISWEK